MRCRVLVGRCEKLHGFLVVLALRMGAGPRTTDDVRGGDARVDAQRDVGVDEVIFLLGASGVSEVRGYEASVGVLPERFHVAGPGDPLIPGDDRHAFGDRGCHDESIPWVGEDPAVEPPPCLEDTQVDGREVDGGGLIRHDVSNGIEVPGAKGLGGLGDVPEVDEKCSRDHDAVAVLRVS